MLIRKRIHWHKSCLIILLLFMAASLSIAMPARVSAAPEDLLEICGDGVTPASFSLERLKDFTQYRHAYSVINTWPSPKWYVGEGVKLRDLLDKADLKENARIIKFYSRDGYTVTLTVKELFRDQRYCYPHFMMNSDNQCAEPIPASKADAEPVEPILALKSVEGSNNPQYMNNVNSPLLMIGQRAVNEQTGNIFVKYVNKIEVLCTEPSQWDAPQANPSGGVVPAGTMVALSNEHMDDDKIYYTTDGSIPTIDSPIYNRISKRWWPSRTDVLGQYNHPIGPINSNMVIKAVTIGPGKADSEVVSFSYQVGTAGDLQESGNQAAAPLLTDIDQHWAQRSIEQLVQSGAVGGYADGSFKPDQNISRAEFAVILSKAFKLGSSDKPVFTDTEEHWARGYIASAVAGGIASGFSAEKFAPDELITREQMAVMVYHAAGLNGTAAEVKYKDSRSVSDWAIQAIAAVNQSGLMKGYPDNSFRPRAYASRAEAVTVIAAALNKLE